jgi:hypothetical protein
MYFWLRKRYRTIENREFQYCFDMVSTVHKEITKCNSGDRLWLRHDLQFLTPKRMKSRVKGYQEVTNGTARLTAHHTPRRRAYMRVENRSYNGYQKKRGLLLPDMKMCHSVCYEFQMKCSEFKVSLHSNVCEKKKKNIVQIFVPMYAACPPFSASLIWLPELYLA